jgi:hypothetical protein
LVKEIGVLFVSQGNRTVDSPIQVRNYQLKPEIPVGGRLKFFQKNWEKITDDQWIISIDIAQSFGFTRFITLFKVSILK